MRITKEQHDFIKIYFSGINSESYLFGSRTDDKKKGGDIDILVLSACKIEKNKIRNFKTEFYKKFGWQKVDLVNFIHGSKHPFLNLIMPETVKL